MDSSAWAIVAATIIGPLAAVGITWGWQVIDRNYQRRLDIFRTLMRFRRHMISPEWVGALNLVPVEFAQDSTVIEAFNRLLDAYNDTGWIGTEDQRRRAGDNAEMASSQLLQRMAARLHVNLHGLDLRRAYAPQGWVTDEETNRAMRDSAFAVLRGARALRVIVDPDAQQPPQPQSPQPQPPPR